MDKHERFLSKVRSRNKLRQQINEKKILYAKLIQHPECLAESLVLKSEIESLELELESLQ